jgi:hypothetical protein
VIPEIMKSPAYKNGGLIAITFDQAPQSGPNADSSSCCDQPQQYPNMPASQQPAASPAPTDTTTSPAPTQTDTTTTPAQTPTDTMTTPTQTDTTTTPAPDNGALTTTGGGGKVGLLLISSYVKPGSVNLANSYNHFSLLRSIEQLFAVDELGYAAQPTVPVFDRVVYNAGSKSSF